MLSRIVAEAQAKLDHIEKIRCEDSLLYFFERAWREIDKAFFKLNWHHVVICVKLEAVTRGDIRNLLINQPPRTGKALDCDTPILTTWGWKRHGDLKKDDFVYGPDGNPVRVLGVTEPFIAPSSTVLFDDGCSIVAADEHLWQVLRDKNYTGPKWQRCRRMLVVKTSDLQSFKPGNHKAETRPDAIDLAAPIHIRPRNFLIDPYLLGVWLGDGNTDSAHLTCGEEDVEHFKPLGQVVMEHEPRSLGGQKMYRILVPELQTRLRVLGILGNKHIPDDYIECSESQRWALLNGLMDTDGTCDKRGRCSHITKLKNLSDSFIRIIWSLSIKAVQVEKYKTLNGKKYGPYYEISFTAPEGALIFTLPRKQARVKAPENSRSRRRYVNSVTSVGHTFVNCIQVEGNLYLAGRQFVVTHNSLLCSVIWPAWCWIQPEDRKGPLSGPHVKFLCISYGATLAETIGQKMLDLVNGPWFAKHWGDYVKIRDDRKSRADFANTAGGERLSNSLHGALLGRGGDCLSGDTMVETPCGQKRVDHIDISAFPEYLLSYDAISKTPTYRRVVAVARRHASTIWRIRTRSGKMVEATGEHRFFTSRGFISAMALVVGDVLLCSVSKEERTPRRRDRQGVSPSANGTILQSGVLNHCEERKGRKQALVLSGMWCETAKQEEIRQGCLQRGMQEAGDSTWRRGSENGHGTALRNLRHEIPADKQQDSGKILLSRMQKFWSFAGYEGYRQSRISEWQCGGDPRWISGQMESHQETHSQSRRLAMHGLCSSRQAASCTPYRFESKEQCRCEPDKPLQELPLHSSWGGAFKIECDDVSVVEKIRKETIVYDLQIDGTETFFANGILVHNCQIIDDPHDPEGAESLAERLSTVRAFAESLPTRVTDPTTSARVMVMQRLHEDDCSGHVLAQMEKPGVAAEDVWEHLRFPQRFESDYASPDDPRTQDGELLWPDFWTEAALRRREMEMGPYAWVGMMQQRPEPRGGGIFKRDWIEPWPPLGPDGKILDGWIRHDHRGNRGIVYPALEYVVAWVDTAFTAKQENDPCAMSVWGVFRAEGKGRIERRGDGTYVRVADEVGFPKAILLFGWQKHLELHGPPQEAPPGVDAKTWNGPVYREFRQESWGLVEWVIDTCVRYKVDYLGIETQGQGHGLEQEMRRQHAATGRWAIELVPARTDKVARAYAIQHLWTARQIVIPQYEDGSHPSWATPLLNELFSFRPGARRDDFVDTATGALQHLRDRGLLQRREEYDADEAELVAYDRNRPAALPYQV